MVEFSEDSTNVKPEKNRLKVVVKEESTLGFVSVSCDLALHKERLQDILDNIPSAVVVLEKPGGMVTYANKRAIELHGVNPCGLELAKHSVKLKIYTMDGEVCP